MRTLVLCALLSVLGLVRAEDSVRSITTSGTAVIPYAPDHAFIPIMIDVETPSFTESEAQVTEIRGKVVEVLKKIGIPKGDITSDSRVLRPHYQLRNNSVIVTGQACIDRCTVRVRDLKLINDVVKVLATVENALAEEPSYASEKLPAAKREALQKAAEAARDKAELLAREAGVKLKEVLSLEETGREWTSEESNVGSFAGNFVGSAKAKDVSNQTVTVTVRARYRIE